LISEEKTILTTLDSFIKFNKIVTNSIIYSKLFQNKNKIEYIKLYCEKIMTANMQIFKNKLTLNYIDCVCILVSKFAHNMESNNVEPHIMFDVLSVFIKQLDSKKQQISIEQIKNKIQINDINDFFTHINESNSVASNSVASNSVASNSVASNSVASNSVAFNIADFNNIIFNK